jgi:hypothetical protein
MCSFNILLIMKKLRTDVRGTLVRFSTVTKSCFLPPVAQKGSLTHPAPYAVGIVSWNLPSSGILRSVGWFRADVSCLRIGPIFKSQSVLLGQLDSWRWDRYVVPKRRCQSNLRCIIFQNTQEFSLTAAEAYEFVSWAASLFLSYPHTHTHTPV